MVIHVMNLIIDIERNIKCILTLNLCLIPKNKIIEINYTYGSLKQPTTKNILWRVTILFISQRKGERGGLFRSKGR